MAKRPRAMDKQKAVIYKDTFWEVYPEKGFLLPVVYGYDVLNDDLMKWWNNEIMEWWNH